MIYGGGGLNYLLISLLKEYGVEIDSILYSVELKDEQKIALWKAIKEFSDE